MAAVKKLYSVEPVIVEEAILRGEREGGREGTVLAKALENEQREKEEEDVRGKRRRRRRIRLGLEEEKTEEEE